MMIGEITGVSLCRVGLAPSVSLSAANESSGSDGCLLVSPGAVPGDGRVPGVAGDDDRVQLAQHRGRDDALRLGRGELVVLAIGQVPVAGGVDGVGLQPQPGSALAAEGCCVGGGVRTLIR
jgi:hypothetical protein